MADSDITIIPTSEFVSFAIETLLVGIFVVTYGIALCVLLVRDGARWRTLSFVASTAMLLLALAHLGLSMFFCYTGFVLHGATAGGMARFLTNSRNPVFVAKSVVYVTQTLLGDTFMAYRIFILWNSSWPVTIAPIMLISAAAVTGYRSCCMLAQDVAEKDLRTMDTPYSSWFLAFLSIATFYTIFTTALVTFRIYRWKRRARHYNLFVPITRRRVFETFIQSAAIYPVVLISLFITYVLGANPEMFGVDLLSPLIGIATTIITIRLGIVEVTEDRRKTKRNNNLFIHRMSASPRMMVEAVRMPPPSKPPTFEPQAEPQEILIELEMGDPARSSSATGFGQDLLVAIERVLGLHYDPSDGADIISGSHSAVSSRDDRALA